MRRGTVTFVTPRTMLIAFLISLIALVLPIETDFLGLKDVRLMMIYFFLGMCTNRLTNVERIYNQKKGIIIWCITAIVLSIALKNLAQQYYIVNCLVAILMISVLWRIATLIPENKHITWLSKHNFTIYI